MLLMNCIETAKLFDLMHYCKMSHVTSEYLNDELVNDKILYWITIIDHVSKLRSGGERLCIHV